MENNQEQAKKILFGRTDIGINPGDIKHGTAHSEIYSSQWHDPEMTGPQPDEWIAWIKESDLQKDPIGMAMMFGYTRKQQESSQLVASGKPDEDDLVLVFRTDSFKIPKKAIHDILLYMRENNLSSNQLIDQHRLASKNI